MQITDPIADMLTRIRNAVTAKHETKTNLKNPFLKLENRKLRR